MSDNSKYRKQYSAEEIQRYLKGEMSAEEMHAIETAALDDPFLADAIEGLQMALVEHDEKTITDNLQDIRSKLQRRTVPVSKVIPMRSFRWWQPAAAAALLIIGSLFVYNGWFRSKPSEMAMAEKKASSAAPSAPAEANNSEQKAPSKSDSQPSKNDQLITGLTPKEKNKKDEANFSSISRSKSSPLTADKPLSLHPAPLITTDSLTLAAIKTDEKKIVDKEEQVNALSKSSAKKQEVDKEKENARGVDLVIVKDASKADDKSKGDGFFKNKSERNSFSGRVLDNNNQPLANAVIKVQNEKNAVVTDQSGSFNISGKDSLLNVNVSSVGYVSQNFQLRNDIPSNQLQLNPDSRGLNEVVTSGYDQGKRAVTATRRPRVILQDAAPVIGWVEFEKYIEKNKKNPAIGETSSGEVVVSFQVKKGELSEFKIEQSLIKWYDAEAIRLIKDGPAWRLLKGKKARVTVIIRF